MFLKPFQTPQVVQSDFTIYCGQPVKQFGNQTKPIEFPVILLVDQTHCEKAGHCLQTVPLFIYIYIKKEHDNTQAKSRFLNFIL